MLRCPGCPLGNSADYAFLNKLPAPPEKKSVSTTRRVPTDNGARDFERRNIEVYMPSSIVRSFSDPDAYHAAMLNTDQQGMVTGRGRFRAEWTGIRLDRLSIQNAKEDLPRVSYSAIHPKATGICFITYPGPPVYIHGFELHYGDIVVYRKESQAHTRTSTACQWGSIGLTHEDLAAAGQVILGRELIAPPATHVIRPPPPLLSRLLHLHQA